MPPRLGLLVGAQFASALGDNALPVVAIALLERRGLPGWWAPPLKFGFMLSHVLLAPFVGVLADALAKGRVTAAMNLVKALGLFVAAAVGVLVLREYRRVQGNGFVVAGARSRVR